MVLLPFLVAFCFLVVGTGAVDSNSKCKVRDPFLKLEVEIWLCGASDPKQCKSKIGEVEAYTDARNGGKCVKCKVPGKSCTKHDDCCSGSPKSQRGNTHRGTCLTGKCTVCTNTNKRCLPEAPLCCETETNNDVQCIADILHSKAKLYTCREDRCKAGGGAALCAVDGYTGTKLECDCTQEKFTNMECRGKTCTNCKRFLGPCTMKSDCCDGVDCVDGKCKPKCLSKKAKCKGESISCCKGLTCRKDNGGYYGCYDNQDAG